MKGVICFMAIKGLFNESSLATSEIFKGINDEPETFGRDLETKST